MDFSQLKAVEYSNTRKPGGLPSKVQEFDDLKYRKAATKKNGVIAKFTVGDKRYEELALAGDNVALRHFIHPTDKNQVFLAVVGDADGKMLRKREGKEKGTNFKSDALEAALNAAGIIDSSLEKTNQFIALKSEGKDVVVDGIQCIEIFSLSKGAKKVTERAAKVETAAPAETTAETGTASTTQAPVADAAQGTTAAPAAAPGSDWD